MYSQCECLEYSGQIFERMHKRALVSWNSLVAGFSINGQAGQEEKRLRLTSGIQIFQGQRNVKLLKQVLHDRECQPPLLTDGEGIGYLQSLSILSAPMDKTMMIWKPEKIFGIWMNVVTVGKLSHCALGFYGGHWSPNANFILAYGYGGSFHLWKNTGESWQPHTVPSGHFSSVTDHAWLRSGNYILSVSHDQTIRIFSPWKNKASLEHGGSWHEITCPQVHGHDINSITIIHGKGNHRFINGAEEKVSRVFEAPLSFLKTLNNAISKSSDLPKDGQSDIQIWVANMFALGLSQKPIYAQAIPMSYERNGIDGLDAFETIPDAATAVLTEPPIEDQLQWHTLWSESHKLYGHGNELFSICCYRGEELVASACKAQSLNVAEIWLW